MVSYSLSLSRLLPSLPPPLSCTHNNHSFFFSIINHFFFFFASSPPPLPLPFLLEPTRSSNQSTALPLTTRKTVQLKENFSIVRARALKDLRRLLVSCHTICVLVKMVHESVSVYKSKKKRRNFEGKILAACVNKSYPAPQTHVRS